MPAHAGNGTRQLPSILGLEEAWCKCLLLEIGLGQLPSGLGSCHCGYINLFGQLPLLETWNWQHRLITHPGRSILADTETVIPSGTPPMSPPQSNLAPEQATHHAHEALDDTPPHWMLPRLLEQPTSTCRAIAPSPEGAHRRDDGLGASRVGVGQRRCGDGGVRWQRERGGDGSDGGEAMVRRRWCGGARVQLIYCPQLMWPRNRLRTGTHHAYAPATRYVQEVHWTTSRRAALDDLSPNATPRGWTGDKYLWCDGRSSECAHTARPAPAPGPALFTRRRNAAIARRHARIARTRSTPKPGGSAAAPSLDISRGGCAGVCWLPNHEGLAHPSPPVTVRTDHRVITSHSPPVFPQS